MKYLYSLLILFSLFTNGYSKSADGYILTLSGDTVSVKIKIPGPFSNFNNKEVDIIDSSNESKTLTPQEIKGYGYNFKGQTYVYMSKIMKDSALRFLEQVIAGKNTSLYQHVTGSGGYGSPHEFYTFEKKDGTYMFLTNYAALDTFKMKLKLFYKEYPEVQTLIDTKFSARRHIQRDIKEVLEAANTL